MRKIILGFVILFSIFSASISSSLFIDKKISGIAEKVSAAHDISFEGNVDLALEILDNAMNEWKGIKDYGSIFISETKLDAVTEAFYSYLSSLSEEKENSIYKKQALIYHLDNIASQERLSLGSIF